MIKFTKIEISQIDLLQQLSTKIWYDNYRQMISQEQIQYMLSLMYNKTLLIEEINSPQFLWYFIVWENNPVGYFCCKRETKKLFLSKLYLDISIQPKGLGQLTLSYIQQIAIQENLNTIYLSVNKHNTKAIKAYEKFGFKKIKNIITDIGNGFVMDDFIYQYNINI